MRRALLAAVIAALAGCVTTSVIGPRQPLVPEGEPVMVSLASGTLIEGELLAVGGTDLVLKDRGGRLVAVDFPALKQVVVKRYEITVKEDWRKRLSVYGRYPQGLTAEQWRPLLAEAGQEGFVRAEN